MYRVDKFYGPERQVLANISLSFLPGREDRRARPERRRQVDAAADHGRASRSRLPATPSSRPARRVGLPRAGARARSREGRARERRGRRARAARPARPLQRDLGRVRRARRRLRRAARGAGEGAGRDRPRATPGSWTRSSTARWTRCALPDGDRDVDDALRRRAPTRRALPAAALGARPAAARRADEPSRRRVGLRGSSASSTTTRARSSPSPTIGTSSTTSPAGSSSSTAARGIPFEGNYSSWLEQKQARLAIEEKQASARQRTLARELEWVRMSPRARHAKSKARLGAYEKMLAEEQNVKLDKVEIHIPPGPAARRRRDRGRRTSRRASATGCSSRT